MPRDREPPPFTKILATLGPATDDPAVLRRVVDAGAGVFRLNFSHGSFEEHAIRLGAVRALAEELDRPLAVVGDLPGPKIRLGEAPADGLALAPGEDVILRAAPEPCVPACGGRPAVLTCAYTPLAREVFPGQRVLINDGAVRMLAIEAVSPTDLLCRVKVGGMVTSRKGVNLPDSDLSMPALTARDREIAAWAAVNQIDYLALSFVRRGSDVAELRALLERRCTGGVCGTGLGDAMTRAWSSPSPASRIPVIAKIETPQAVKNIEEILEVADGLMVARGDLGVEMDVARVPMIQKRLIAAAHDFGRPCIVATQMLESMISSATPTRAEVSDVANAILDGADAIMLSGETAVGRYPALAVDTMRRVALATEESARERPPAPNPPERLRRTHARVPALAHGAWHMARDAGAVLVAVWSQDGGAARYISRHAFNIPIIAFSTDPVAVRRMALLFSVVPVLARAAPAHRSEFAAMVDRHVQREGWAAKSEPMVVIAGKPLDDPAATNTAAIRTVGEMTSE